MSTRAALLLAVAVAVASSSGCHTGHTTPSVSDPTPDTAVESPPAPAEDPLASRGPDRAPAPLHLRVSPSGFDLDCAPWRAWIDEYVEAEVEPGSQAYTEAIALRRSLAELDSDQIPAGTQVGHVYLALFTALDRLVARHRDVEPWLRSVPALTLALEVDANVNLQMVLDVIHTITHAKVGGVAVTGGPRGVVARLELTARAAPITSDDVGVAVNGETLMNGAETWPQLVELLVELHGHGHRLALVSHDAPPAGSEPRPKPKKAVIGGPIDRSTHDSPLDHGVVVRPLDATLDGAGLGRDIVTRIVRAHINELRSCYYATGLRHDPKMSGEISIEFAIGGRGQVIVAIVHARTGSLSPVLGECMAVALERWKFPKPRGGGEVVVRFPFALRPK